MADNNNQRAQNFAGGFSRKNIDSVSFGSKKADQAALLEDIREIVAAAAQDIYGEQDDPKYIYIVDLILKRIKRVLDDISLKDSLDEIKDKLSAALSKSTQSEDSNNDTIVESSFAEVCRQLEAYNKSRKEDHDELKSALAEMLDSAEATAKEHPIDVEQNQEDVSDQLDAVALKVNESLMKSVQLQNAQFASFTQKLDSINAAIGTGFTNAMQSISDANETLNKSIDGADYGAKMAVSSIKTDIIDSVQTSNTAVADAVSANISKNVDAIDKSCKASMKHSQKSMIAAKKANADALNAVKTGIDQSVDSVKKGIKKNDSMVASLGARTDSLFKKRTKGLKKMQNSIEDSISAMGSIVSGAMSAVMGPIGLAVKVMFGAFKVIMKPLKWILKLFTDPLMLVLFLGGTLLVLYNFFRPTFDKIVNKVSGWIAGAVEIYETKIKPAIDIVKKILGDDKKPLGERIKLAAKEGGKALYKNFFPNGIGAFFTKLWTDTLKPQLVNNVIPWLAKNWKPIVAAIGIGWLISNPFGPITLLLNSIKAISLAIKAATVIKKFGGAVGGVVKGMMSVLTAIGPIGWAIIGICAVVGAMLAIGWKMISDARAEAAKNAENIYDNMQANSKATMSRLKKIDDNTDKIFKDFGDVLESAGIKKPEELAPQVYELEDGSIVGKEQIDSIIKEANARAKPAGIDQLDKEFAEGEFGDLDRLSSSDSLAVFGSYFAEAKTLIASVNQMLNAYVKDPTLQVDNKLLVRYNKAIKQLKDVEKYMASSFQELRTHAAGAWNPSGYDGEEMRQAGEQITSKMKQLLESVVQTMVQIDDQGNTVTGVDAKKLARTMMLDMSLQAESVAQSKNQEKMKKAMSGESNAGLSTLGMIMDSTIKRSEKDMDKFIAEAGLDKQNTKVANEMKTQLKELSQVAARSYMAKNKVTKIDPAVQRKLYEDAMLKLYRQKKEELAKNPNDIALQKVVESLEKNLGSIKEHKEYADQTASIRGNLEKELAANDFDLTQEDANVKEGIDNALKTSFQKGNLKDINDIKSMDPQKQKELLEDIKKSLADQKVDDSKQKEVMDALGKLLKNTEEIKNKEPDKTTVVSNNVIAAPQKQNLAADAKRNTSTDNKFGLS